jgi:hypothetical protein
MADVARPDTRYDSSITCAVRLLFLAAVVAAALPSSAGAVATLLDARKTLTHHDLAHNGPHGSYSITESGRQIARTL